MALVTKSATASVDANSIDNSNRLSGLLAGEAIAAFDLVRIHSDGTVMLCNATALNASAYVDGIAAGAADSGQPVTIFKQGARIKYATGLTPAAILYAGATAGRLDTAATTGDATGVAKVVSATDIVIIRANGKNAA